MALRGKKPTEIQKRLKVFFWGAEGTGKTFTSIHFPKPYLIDTEHGAENKKYTKVLNERGGRILQTNIWSEIIDEVIELMTTKHDYKTLIIDSLTMVYTDMADEYSKTVGTEFGRHYSEAKKQIRRLIQLLLRLDMNVIITSHEKKEYGADMAVIGKTFDCYDKLSYLFDLTLHIKKISKDNRTATVKKTRLDEFPDGEVFQFSYQEIAKRYDEGILEKESEPEILASDNQVIELKRLIDLIKVPEKTTSEWLKKSGASDFNEMPEKNITACIEWAKKQIEPTK